MKKSFVILALAALLLPFTVSAKKTSDDRIKVMSYNIRYGNADDGTNSWKFRYPLTAMMLMDQKPDVVGMQEPLKYQLDYIKEYVKPYKYVGVGREDGKTEGEYSPIFYNSKKISLVKWGFFWLSETPDKPGKGWDARHPRTAVWAILKDKTSGRKFIAVNTHLDHRGKEAQEKGAALIVERIARINRDNLPVVLTGDFNLGQDSPLMSPIENAYVNTRRTALRSDDGATFNGWGKSKSKVQIDHIYQTGFQRCQEFSVITKKYENRAFISDHYPIVAELVF